MKQINKLFAVIMSLVLLLTMLVPSFAATNESLVNITAPETDRIYAVIQIMTGDCDNGVLSDLK